METICHSVANDFFYFEACVYYLSRWFLFHQFKRLASNFFSCSGSWRVISMSSIQYSAPSCHVCVTEAQERARVLKNVFTINQHYKIYLGFLSVFIRRSCPSQRILRWRSIVNIIGCPHLDSTTIFVVLLIQQIPSSFLGECI